MVTIAARQCWILCGFLFLVGSSHAGELVFQLTKNHIELGQGISARLLAFNAEGKLAAIDLTPLYEDFAVIGVEDTSGAATAKAQALNLQLFPRHTGVLTVPPLMLGNLQSPAQTVNVSNAMEHGSAMLIDLKISAQQIWQRQQLLASVEIKSPDRFFTVELEPFKLRGFEVKPFVMAREPIDGDSHYKSRIHLGWAIFPLLSGDFQLELPMIRYLQKGRTQRRFYLPRIRFQVQELPAYIPPNMPVAKVSVESSTTNEGLLRTGDMAYWNITLSAGGTLDYWLPPVLHGVQSTNDIEYFAAESQPSLRMDSNGTQASVVHQVPFKPLRSGSVDLPKLKIQYFDPDTGRIETFYHQTDPPMAWNVPLIVTTVLVTLGLAVLGWRLVARRYIRYYARYRQKQIALQMVQQAKSAQEIFIGLRRYALAEGWPANLTISDYGIYWQQQYRVSADFGALLQRLSRTLYGGQSNYSLQELQQGLLQNLRKPQRRRQTSQSSNTVWNINYIFVPQKKAL